MRYLRMMAVVLVAGWLVGCRSTEPQVVRRATHDNFSWYDARFTVGMPKTEALKQLEHAPERLEFDPASDATIIRPTGDFVGRDRWLLTIVGREPVGRQALVALHFDDDRISEIEIVSEFPRPVARSVLAVKTVQSFAWSNTKLAVGMRKDEVHRQLLLSPCSPETGGVSSPDSEEARADIWLVYCAGPQMIGNEMTIRLTFEDRVLRRIQIVEIMP